MHPQSREGNDWHSKKMYSKKELDLFTHPHLQNTIQPPVDTAYSSTTSISPGYGPLVFRVERGPHFIDLSKCYLKIKIQVRRQNGASLPDADKDIIFPVNMFGHALFEKISILLNGIPVGTDSHFHSQSTVISYLLSTDKLEFLHSCLWSVDGRSEVYELGRHPAIAKSRELNMTVHLAHDIFTSPRLLLGDVELTLNCERTRPEFSLIRKVGSDQKYTIKYLDCQLVVRKVLLAPEASSVIARQLGSGKQAIYPYKKLVTRNFEIPQGASQWKLNRIFSGKVPCKLVVALTNPVGLSGGSLENNPMIFPACDYKCTSVQLYLDNRVLEHTPYEISYDSDGKPDVYNAYAELMKALGIHSNMKDGNMVGHYGFQTVYTFFVFDILYDCSSVAPDGSVAVEFKFARPTTENIGVLAIGDFPSKCEIFPNGQVTDTYM